MLALIPPSLGAQNFSYSVSLQKVNYGGTELYAIRNDSGQGVLQDYDQWQAAKAPVDIACKSGSTLSASATFDFTCESMPSQIYVRGLGPDGIEFPSLQVQTDSGMIVYPQTWATLAFDSLKVRYFESFTVSWQISFNGNDWYPAGESSNTLYVTYTKPENESNNKGFKWYQTLFYLSCKNADGATTEEQIIEGIWNDFTDHSVQRHDGKLLTYYRDIFSMNSTLGALIKNTDGVCYTWAMLFLALLKMHGITESHNYINISSDYTQNSCDYITKFLVKDWTFGTPGNYCADMPYINVYDEDYFESDSGYWFLYEEIYDQMGIMGQTAQNPASMFGNHQIALVKGKYYDPSYGITYNSIADIRYTSISGWGNYEFGTEADFGIDFNGNSVIDDDDYYSPFTSTPDIEAADFQTYIETW